METQRKRADIWQPNLGKGGATKSDEFLKKIQTAFALPLLNFGKL